MKSLRRLLIGAPLLTLAAALITICVRFHTAWPWNVVVHEDGRRTLVETIFYFQHALGELPLEALLAATVAGALLRFRKPAAPQSFVWVMLVAAVAVDSAAFGVSAMSFTDPQYLGHQARETFTHGLVTVPLAVGTCLGLAEAPRETAMRLSWLAAFGCLFLLLYQAA